MIPPDGTIANAQGNERDRIAVAVTEILQREGSLKRKTLVDSVETQLGNANRNTIEGTLHYLEQNGTIRKVERAVFALATSGNDHGDTEVVEVQPQSATAPTASTLLSEQDFYEPFAYWLLNDLEDCTQSCALGGSFLGPKWGTPDAVGVYKVSPRSFYRPAQIVSFVSAEIKLGDFRPIEAYGQACAYLLFSHKVYLVLPKNISDKDKSRIEALCIVAGLGFVLFNPDVSNPDFEIRVRLQFREPDEYYLNEVLDNEQIIRGLSLE
jgi:hypothetical protein